MNLIGEHTDYNLGLVLPMAIDEACWIAAAPSCDGRWLRVYSEQLAAGSQWRVEDISNASPVGDWTDRVLGIAWELSRRGVTLCGMNVLIDSEVPLGGGLSSSAALGVSLALALGGPREPLELAQLARVAEMIRRSAVRHHDRLFRQRAKRDRRCSWTAGRLNGEL